MVDSYWGQHATLMESRLRGLNLERPVWEEFRPVLDGSLVAVVRSVAEQATGRHRRYYIATEMGADLDVEQIRTLYRQPDFPILAQAA